MQTIQIEVEDVFYNDMISRGIDIQKEFNKMIKKISYNQDKEKKDAFAILKTPIEDPIAWQKKLRQESDRDIYSEIIK